MNKSCLLSSGNQRKLAIGIKLLNKIDISFYFYYFFFFYTEKKKLFQFYNLSAYKIIDIN